MKIIGITGGVGSGKTEVLEYLARNYECTVIQADEAAHLLMKPGKACYPKVVALLGPGFVDEEGELNRPKVSSVVFRDPGLREKINGIVHPAVKEYITKQIKNEEKEGTPYFFIEAALLIEDKYDEICDELWYIYADEQVRRERLMESREYTAHKIDEIIASQLSEDEFEEHCNFTIDNSGELEEMIRQIDQRMNFYETM
ncbi:MAG: dephospho-CoA kinase [Lachnospiraceae bacterium]|nr:dephospho-CoA kinase [Lachnospiraceae bacterium]